MLREKLNGNVHRKVFYINGYQNKYMRRKVLDYITRIKTSTESSAFAEKKLSSIKKIKNMKEYRSAYRKTKSPEYYEEDEEQYN